MMMIDTDKSTHLKKDILTYTVYKSNKLVHAISDFSAMQHRIILCCIAQIKKTDTSLKVYSVNASDITDYKNYRHLRYAVKKLQNTSIGIYEDGVWTSYPFVVRIALVKEQGLCVINVVFNTQVESCFLGIRGDYTRYTLANVMKFTCNYSLRIYELCKRFARKPGYADFDIDYLRTVLNLHNKYKNYAHFRKYVLNPALAEINEYSDLHVSLGEFKSNKSVTLIKFMMKSRMEYVASKTYEYFSTLSS